MAFLVPALIALICDIGVIWLSYYTKQYNYSNHDMNDTSSNNTDNNDWIYYSIDIYCGMIPAMIRLCILCIPLLYHSYTGTAIRHILWYRTIYSMMIVLVLFHIIIYLIINPKSIETIFMMIDKTTNNTTNTIQLYNYRRLWYILVCNSISLFFHNCLLLRHVRSTAPTQPMMIRMLYQQNNNLNNKHNRYNDQNRSSSSSNNNNSIYRRNMYSIQSTIQPTMYFAVRTANAVAASLSKQQQPQHTTTVDMGSSSSIQTSDHHNDNDIGQEPALMHAMNEFLMDMQIRLQRTKQDWSNRLDDFGHRMVQQQQHLRNGNSNHNNGSNNNNNNNNQNTHGVMTTTTSVSPFRTLLQLFAYEDVLENHRLDSVFDMDDGIALTFYVPQLLSFLLHGALYTSPALEDWILHKCTKNIYFAHRCYWYLRAWCLEVPAESRPISPSLSRRNSATSLSTTNLQLTNGTISTLLSQQQQQQQQHSQNNDGFFPYLDEPAGLEKKETIDGNSSHSRVPCLPGTTNTGPSPNQHNISVTSTSSHPDTVVLTNPMKSTPSVEKDKFLIPEEREMIERFMMRVKECGQIPAEVLEFGISSNMNSSNNDPVDDTNDSFHVRNINNSNYEPIASPERQRNGLTFRGGNNTINSSSMYNDTLRSSSLGNTSCHYNDEEKKSSANNMSIESIAQSGIIPIDPISGSPSINHYDVLMMQQHHDSYGFRQIREQQQQITVPSRRQCETAQFDKTPQFLDALIFLAENLFYIPRENRRETLRQQLQALECELLPSNSIYLPIGCTNQYHRVWRIVAEESIAISTKERVPCIVALEVIDFSSSHHPLPSFGADKSSGRLTDTLGSENPNSIHSVSSSPQVPSSFTIQSDSDLVSEWRYGYRNPFRYVPFLDKVTTSVKVPFVKMKTQVRDHFNNIRERGATEEMMALSSADALVDSYELNRDPVNTLVIEGRPGNFNNELSNYNNRQFDHIEAFIDTESGTNGMAIDDPIRSLSRMNSTGSMVSLGQWSSPSTLLRNVSDADKHQDLTHVKKRLDVVLHEKSHKPNPLLYGSDQEDEPSERGIKHPVSRYPPRSLHSSTNSSTTAIDSSKEAKDPSANLSSRPPPVVFRESWVAKQERVRKKSAFGDHPGWKLLAILVKGNDDLRQEQLAAQLIQRMATILACEKVNVWLCPYEIIATTNRGGVIEAIPDTISIDSLKKNDPNFTTLNDFFISHYGEDTDELAGAKANFVESLAAYSMVCFILQLKDRHNGNILLDKWGRIIHIDFGFFFLSSPGKNAGFESAPFKLTRDFVEVLDGTNSHLFRIFRELCYKTFIALRRRCLEIILLVEMLKNGNEDLKCFRGRPEDAIQQLRDRFRLDLNDRACKEYVNCLIDDSIENWRTDWYDRYQRYFVGVL